MFVIVEYVNYRKNQNMKYYGYFNDQESAIKYAQELAERHCEENKMDFVTDNLLFHDNHFYIKNNDNNKLIKEFCCVSLEKMSDESIKDLLSNCEEKETVKKFITDCAGKIEFPKYESIKNELISDQTIEKVREILEYVATIKPTCRDFGPEIYNRSSQVFAVIQICPLH